MCNVTVRNDLQAPYQSVWKRSGDLEPSELQVYQLASYAKFVEVHFTVCIRVGQSPALVNDRETVFIEVSNQL